MKEILELIWELPTGIKALIWLVSLLFIYGEAVVGAFVETGVWIVNRTVNGKRYNKRFHRGWTVQRAMMYVPWFILWATMYHWAVFAGIAATVAWFIFLHDGMYYFFRDKEDGSYPDEFTDCSTTSSAETYTFCWKGRVALLIVGIIGMFFMVYLKHSM